MSYKEYFYHNLTSKSYSILVVIFVLLLYFFGLSWIALWILGLSLVLFLIHLVIKIFNLSKISTALYLFFVFFLAILFRIFVIEIYVVTSNSMKNSIIPGDKILLSKLNYGPKIPNELFNKFYLNASSNPSPEKDG